MSAWEYKFITSGKGGFATPALLEAFLNQLGQEEWEILEFQSPPDNPLAFSGLARRSTQREWNLADAATAAARVEADKLRAEFEAKFKGIGSGASSSSVDEPAEAAAPDVETSGGTYRKPRNTESDLDPDLAEEEGGGDDWDKIAKEDELPTFFEAIQPLMRRNQRGDGLAAGVEHLAKRWNLPVADVIDALKECGFVIPEDENVRPAYVEYDGDLFWVNMNRRGELWINTREKPRPVFRPVAGRPVPPEEAPAAAEASGHGERRRQEQERPAPTSHPTEEKAEQEAGHGRSEESSPRDGQRRGLPEGPALLERIRPMMRRERGGAGRSGSISFLCRALKCRDNELGAALEALGLKLPEGAEPPVQVDLAGGTWWLYRDQRGGIWINQRSLRQDGRRQGPDPGAGEAGAPSEGTGSSGGEGSAPSPADLSSEAPAAPSPGSETGESPAPPSSSSAPSDPATAVLAAARLLLKPTKTGGVAAVIGRLAETVNKTSEEFLAALVGAGLVVPEKPREKPVFVEHAGEIFWLNKNVKGELWLNAKASKFAQGSSGGEERKPRGRRSR
jgi:hypothetical protein